MSDYALAGSWVQRPDELDAADDERIAHYHRQRQGALEAIQAIDTKHVRHFDFDNGRETDVTDEHRAFEQQLADRMDALIKAWQQIKAARG